MSIIRVYIVILSALLAAGVNLAVAAAELPHIGYVYPAGGAPGTEFEIRIGGQFIYGAKSGYVSGQNVTVQVIDAMEPKKKKPTSQKKAIDEVVKLKVSISQDAAPGTREVSLITDAGISNKLRFEIGQLKEIAETEPNDKREKAVILAGMPALINGQIMPGDVDFFKFTARKGQHLVFAASARALIPYLADAVPGWCKICLTLYDAQGKELAFADDFRYEQDPVLFYNIPADGDYFLAVRDSIYRGREDFVYRVRIGELPYITHIFPLGAASSKNPVAVNVSGVNLPATGLAVKVDKPAPAMQKISIQHNGLVSNRVSFAVSALPEILAADAGGNSRETPQKITLPTVINGRILETGGKNYFCFAGKKGQAVVMEVHARRLGSPLDSFVALFNCRGEKLKENDDCRDLSEGALTHHADSGLTHILPEDGIYTIQINDTQGRGGGEYAYRLRVSAPAPDFELIATPSNLTIPRGGAAALTIVVMRKDGFNGPIKLNLRDNAAGLTLNGTEIPANSNKIRITISSSEPSRAGIALPVLQGTALIDGVTVCRTVTPADDEMQAFSLHHLVEAGETTALLNDSALFVIAATVPAQSFIELAAGKEICIPLAITRKPDLKIPISIQLIEPPKGISIKNGYIPADKDKYAIILKAEANVPPGMTGNLILTGTAYVDKTEPAAHQQEESKAPSKMQENKEKDNTGGNNADPKIVSNKEAPKMKKEKITITLPAIPIKIIRQQPDKANKKV